MANLQQPFARDNKRVVSLKESLYPMRILTYYGGILPDWGRQDWSASFINYISISMFFVFIICATTYETVQLAIKITSVTSIRHMIMNFIWFCPFPLVIWTQIRFLLRRKHIAALVDDWTQMEQELSSLCDAKWLHRFLYFLYFSMAVGSLIFLGAEIYANPNESYLISHYAVIRETLTLPVTGSFHLIAILLAWILIVLSDILPSFLYYHFGCAISSLSRDLVRCFNSSFKLKEDKFSVAVRRIWSRFEKISQFLERTNRLFGSLIVLSHGFCVVMTSTLLYLLLNEMGTSSGQKDRFVFLVNIFGGSLRFISNTILAAKVDGSTSLLRTNLTGQMSHQWDQIPKEDREVLVVFLNRLQCSKVAACPMGLYYLTLSLLLNMAGLIISYVIILLQSN